MKAQVKIDFIIGTVMFGLLVLFLASQISNSLRAASLDSNFDSLRASGTAVMTTLLTDKDWLAESEPYALSLLKVDSLADDCNRLQSLELISYRLRIFLTETGTFLLNCGSVGLPDTFVTISRFVEIDGEKGEVSLDLW